MHELQNPFMERQHSHEHSFAGSWLWQAMFLHRLWKKISTKAV
jgi:hypothetical protein